MSLMKYTCCNEIVQVQWTVGLQYYYERKKILVNEDCIRVELRFTKASDGTILFYKMEFCRRFDGRVYFVRSDCGYEMYDLIKPLFDYCEKIRPDGLI